MPRSPQAGSDATAAIRGHPAWAPVRGDYDHAEPLVEKRPALVTWASRTEETFEEILAATTDASTAVILGAGKPKKEAKVETAAVEAPRDR